ncbi:hypothetical protein GCM10009624_07130 [Gordonia sinesedis]
MSPDPMSVTVLAAPAGELSGSDAFAAEVGLPKLREDLLADHVAAPADQVPALREVVEYARSEGNDVNFVVLTQVAPKFTYYRDIATALQKETGGTVIVLAPNSVGSSSPYFSRVQQEEATDNLTLQNPPQAARQMYDQMTEPGVNWTVVTIVLIVLVVVAAVVARLRSVRGRSRGPADVTAEPTPQPAPVAGGADRRDSDADA